MPLVRVANPYTLDLALDAAPFRLPDATRLMLGGASEDSDQRRLKVMLDKRGLLWCHTPNEGQRDHAARGSALARGLKRGVPDVMIYAPLTLDGVEYAGLALELKRSDGVRSDVSEDQARWLLGLRRAGWVAEWARGYAEAERLVRLCYG